MKDFGLHKKIKLKKNKKVIEFVVLECFLTREFRNSQRFLFLAKLSYATIYTHQRDYETRSCDYWRDISPVIVNAGIPPVNKSLIEHRTMSPK